MFVQISLVEGDGVTGWEYPGPAIKILFHRFRIGKKPPHSVFVWKVRNNDGVEFPLAQARRQRTFSRRDIKLRARRYGHIQLSFSSRDPVDVLRLHTVIVAENPPRPQSRGIEPTWNAHAFALKLRRFLKRRILAHKDVGLAKFAVGENGNGHKRFGAARWRQIVGERNLSSVVLAGQKLLVALAVLFEGNGFELEVCHLHPAVAQRFSSQVIARGKGQDRSLDIAHHYLSYARMYKNFLSPCDYNHFKLRMSERSKASPMVNGFGISPRLLALSR